MIVVEHKYVILNGLDGAVFSCFCDFASRSLSIDSEAVLFQIKDPERPEWTYSFELNETFMILLEDIVMHLIGLEIWVKDIRTSPL